MFLRYRHRHRRWAAAKNGLVAVVQPRGRLKSLEMKVKKAGEGLNVNLAMKTMMMKPISLMSRKPAPRKRARSGKGTITPIPTQKRTKL